MLFPAYYNTTPFFPFSPSALSICDAIAGTLLNISVGYFINRLTKEPSRSHKARLCPGLSKCGILALNTQKSPESTGDYSTTLLMPEVRARTLGVCIRINSCMCRPRPSEWFKLLIELFAKVSHLGSVMSQNVNSGWISLRVSDPNPLGEGGWGTEVARVTPSSPRNQTDTILSWRTRKPVLKGRFYQKIDD